MRFHARIGVLPHESSLPQPIEVDLTVWRRDERGASVIDYRALYALTERAIGTEHTPYLEDLARRVVGAALDVPGVTGARVAVRKPHVLLPGPLAYAEVVLEHGSDD
jgi:dihydroneopterin aldolase